MSLLHFMYCDFMIIITPFFIVHSLYLCARKTVSIFIHNNVLSWIRKLYVAPFVTKRKKNKNKTLYVIIIYHNSDLWKYIIELLGGAVRWKLDLKMSFYGLICWEVFSYPLGKLLFFRSGKNKQYLYIIEFLSLYIKDRMVLWKYLSISLIAKKMVLVIHNILS